MSISGKNEKEQKELYDCIEMIISTSKLLGYEVMRVNSPIVAIWKKGNSAPSIRITFHSLSNGTWLKTGGRQGTVILNQYTPHEKKMAHLQKLLEEL